MIHPSAIDALELESEIVGNPLIVSPDTTVFADDQIDRALLIETNHQLKIRNEELTHAARLKDEFLANMSHELRTPLNAIIGMTEGLQEGIFGAANPAQSQAIEMIERSSNHLLELINEIGRASCRERV